MKHIQVIKRDGRVEDFEKEKIIVAIEKVYKELGIIRDGKMIDAIASDIRTLCYSLDHVPTVDEVHDFVELKLSSKNPKVALAYAKYRTRREMIRREGWQLSELGKRIYESKYRNNNESFECFLNRVSGGNNAIKKRIAKKQFLFGGRILAGRGLQNEGRKITFSNCYVLPSPKDNIESIFDTAKRMARTFSYGGGVGIDISNLRPKGMAVNNSAIQTTGSTSFMDLFSTTTGIIGQKGRRGALMISMDINHPDIYDFLKSKTDLNKVTFANISCKVTDSFMDAVEQNDMWELRFYSPEANQTFTREVHAVNLFELLCKLNWDYAEPK